MRVVITPENDYKLSDNFEPHVLSNGGYAILDKNDKLISYSKRPQGENNWDWVRKDFRNRD